MFPHVGVSFYRPAANQQRNIDALMIASCGSAYSISKYQFQVAKSLVILESVRRQRRGRAKMPRCPALLDNYSALASASVHRQTRWCEHSDNFPFTNSLVSNQNPSRLDRCGRRARRAPTWAWWCGVRADQSDWLLFIKIYGG